MDKLFLNRKSLIILFMIIGIYSLVMFLEKYPVYYAAKHVPEGFVFTGQASWFDPWDVNVYVSTLKSGQKHGLLLPNLFTTEDYKPVIFYPLYTLTGYLFKNCDSYFLFQVISFITTFLLCVGIFIAAYLILGNSYYSLAATVFVLLGSGLGWLSVFHIRSADVFITSFTFKSAIQRPHEAVGVLLYILSMVFFTKFIETNKGIYNVISFFSLFLLIFFYPYYIPVYFSVFAFCISFFKVNNIKSAWMVLFRNTAVISIFTLLYYIYLRNSSFSSAISEKLPRISIMTVLLGYGFYLLGYVYSAFRLKRVNFYHGMLFVWITFCLIASYFPLGFSRFYLRGLFFPLGLLMVFVIRDIFLLKKGRGILGIVCCLILLSDVLTWVDVFNYRVNATHQLNRWYYLPVGYKKAFDYISKLPGDGILASPYILNLIPAYTGKKVFLGHKIQTLNYSQKMRMIDLFCIKQEFSGLTYSFLKANHISYVIYGDYERSVGYKDPVPLNNIYSQDNVKVYGVD